MGFNLGIGDDLYDGHDSPFGEEWKGEELSVQMERSSDHEGCPLGVNCSRYDENGPCDTSRYSGCDLYHSLIDSGEFE